MILSLLYQRTFVWSIFPPPVPAPNLSYLYIVSNSDFFRIIWKEHFFYFSVLQVPFYVKLYGKRKKSLSLKGQFHHFLVFDILVDPDVAEGDGYIGMVEYLF